MHISGQEVIIVLILFLIFFGARKLPDAAKSIGKAFKVFKKEVRDMKDDVELSDKEK